jgi:PAS domain S-box-containing protein
MRNYLQALQECCRDEAAFVRLQQILGETGQNVEEVVCLCSKYGTRKSGPPTTTPYWPNHTHRSMAMRLSEERFQRIAATIPGVIFQALHRYDGSRLLLFVSSGCRELLEIEPHSAQENLSRLWKLIHRDDRKAYEKSVADSAASLQPWNWEGRLITNSGKLKWVKCAANLSAQDNGDIIWDGLLMEITARKQAEEALRWSEEKFSIAFRSSPDSMSITTLSDGRYIDVNDSFVRISGYQREEVIGRTSIELNAWVNPEDRVKMQQIMQSEGAVHNLEFEFRKKSGEVGVYLFSAEVINLGGRMCLLSVSTDITERKRTEAWAKAAAERDRLLGETALRIRRSLDLDEILETTVTEVRQFLQADRVFISQFDDNGQCRVVAKSVDPQWP